jgi:predicted RND superfamily exporter protein
VSPYPFKPWSQRMLELIIGLLAVLILLPAVLVLVKPLLTIATALVVIVLAVRGLGSYVASRRNRW